MHKVEVLTYIKRKATPVAQEALEELLGTDLTTLLAGMVKEGLLKVSTTDETIHLKRSGMEFSVEIHTYSITRYGLFFLFLNPNSSLKSIYNTIDRSIIIKIIAVLCSILVGLLSIF